MRLYRRRKRFLVQFIILAFIACIFCFIHFGVRPMIGELAIAETSDIVTFTVNDTISDKMSDGSINYNELVSFEKDANGRITALMTDMNKINALQAEITNDIIKRLNDKSETKISIPIGNFFGSPLFSGHGPNIDVKIISVTNVDTAFFNRFSSAGINQTRHQIMLNISVELTILVPGYRSSIMVPTEICVAETVIVGDVPGSYANLDKW